MKLFTSYYARSMHNPRAISISASAPEYFRGPRYAALAPTWAILNEYKMGTINADQYTEQYLDLLKQRKLDPHQVIEHLGDGSIMLCYEKPGDFCHRRIAAAWLSTHTAIEIQELTFDEIGNKPKQQTTNVDQFFTF